MNAKTVKPLITIATIRNGKINWVAQPGMGNDIGRKSLIKWGKTFGEKVIKVEIREVVKDKRHC